MLTLEGRSPKFCDHVSRRGFMQIGAAGFAGLTLADVLRADSVSGATRRPKSLISICLPGGPTHLDTFDLKPEAPVEVRGELRPIPTVVPGFEICELMPMLAGIADKFAVIRSISDFSNEHSTRQADSGWPEANLKALGGRPGMGAVATKMLGPIGDCPVTSVTMGGHTSPGFLGQSFKDFGTDNAGRSNMKLSMKEDRLHDRKRLLAELDGFRRTADGSGAMVAMDRFTQEAIEVVTSPRFSEALEIEREPASSAERYGLSGSSQRRNTERFLTARRLVEAGVRVVSFTFGGWDTHANNFTSMRNQLPTLDRGLSALIYDLEERNLLQDTMIIMSGEFGRTPRINMTAGRDHWPGAGFVFVAGGGFKTGQFIGTTDRIGAKPIDRPIHLQQVYAAVARKLGIDLETQQLRDPVGRPQYLFEHREVINELI
jgi:hypothetical protein